MHVAICCNHSWPSCGGSERVIQMIAEAVVNKGHKSSIFSFSLHKPIIHNGVSLIPCSNSFAVFCNQLELSKADYLFVYSDCFRLFPKILDAAEVINMKKGIALVGMNYMLEHRDKMKRFFDKRDYFDIVTHSNNYQDFARCTMNGITPIVIPNGIDLKEFDESFNFREKYDIKTKFLIICVSNFFPGKGHEYLTKVIEQLHKIRNDFTMVYIHSSVNFPYATFCENNCKTGMNKIGCNFRILKDIPRNHVIGAFKQADIFAFPSQKEVAPLVILEAMSSKLPWVALPVGNVSSLAGGKLVPYYTIERQGFTYGELTYSTFVKHLDDLMNYDSERNKLGEEGRSMIESDYNWEKISDQYIDLFSKHA